MISTRLLASVMLVTLSLPVVAQQAPSMIEGNRWSTDVALTIGDTINGYQMPGIPDGLAAYPMSGNRALVLVNHELNPGNGYAYQLANGTLITGARVSSMIIERNGNQVNVSNAGLAYDKIYDRNGQLVTNPSQVNETGNAIDGFARFCSSQGVLGGTYGFVDDIYFTGEETSKPFHPHGGTEWAIDVAGKAIWAVPALGRGAWENVTPINTGNLNTVALLLGDDSQSAGLYLYIGQKNALGDGSFLDRNGLAVGQVYCWAATSGVLDPQAFNGEGSVEAGTFVPVAVQDASMAGMPGYDAAGYLDIDTLQAATDALGCFSFSRPEDLHTNPQNGSQVVFASTGRGGLFPADNWGTIYTIDMTLNPAPAATLTIIHDADGIAVPDEGIRSPDNLTWANDGFIYIQEDRSTSPSSLFGGATGIEASVWKLDPVTRTRERIGQVNRSVVLPQGSTDRAPGDIGNWETSGVIDVTDLFETKTGETLLLATVQAHGIRDGLIGDNPRLDEGGQILFMKNDATMVTADFDSTAVNGFEIEQVFTVSDTIDGYQPTGILDGTGAFPAGGQSRANILVNSELNPGNGYAYTLANGTQLTGARVHAFLVERLGPNQIDVLTADLAYDTIYDRQGMEVTNPAQVNETGNAIDGFARFCSSQHVLGGTYNFVDDIFFTGEETSKPFHPHGGTEWAIDVDGKAIWAVPALGRGAWENVTPVDPGDPSKVALLLGDDSASAPLYLWVGDKDANGTGSFLDRNGLEVGTLYVWVATSGVLDPQAFNGAGSVETGTFVPITVRDQAMAGMPGYDAMGYLDIDTMQNLADTLGAFSFSRPEDLHTNPQNGRQVVFASTGRGALFPADNWGTLYIINMNFSGAAPAATLSILHDADGLPVPDEGVRSPDNLTWANDGFVYVQEDRSTSPSSLFGAVSGAEASIWKVNPSNGFITRIAEVDRSVVLPVDATDRAPGDIGNWETSGVLDVSDFFDTAPGETLLIATVQAHGIRNGSIGDNPLLDEGGQLVFLRQQGLSQAITSASVPGGSEVTFSIRNGTPGNGYFHGFTLANAGIAPLGNFYGVDLSINDILTFATTPPFFASFDGNGNAEFNVPVPGLPAPLGLTIDAVSIELNGFQIVTSVAGTFAL